MKLSPGLNDPQEARGSEGARREQAAALTAEPEPGKTRGHSAPRPGASRGRRARLARLRAPAAGPAPVPALRPPPQPGPRSPVPGPRAAPLLRPMVHSGFLRRTCGSPSSAPRRSSRPQGGCCGGCSPSAGGSIGLASDETRKRRGRLIARGGGGRLPSPRPPGLSASAAPPRAGPGRLPPPASRPAPNPEPAARRGRCQQTARGPQLIRGAGPAASAPRDWLAAAPSERRG